MSRRELHSNIVVRQYTANVTAPRKAEPTVDDLHPIASVSENLEGLIS